MMVQMPAMRAAWAMWWHAPGDMTRAGQRFVRWLRLQDDPEAIEVARVIEEFDDQARDYEAEEKWLDRWSADR